MDYFGLIRLLPLERYRAIRPWASWAPGAWIQALPPGKIGEVSASVNGSQAHGTLWVTSNYNKSISWPRLASGESIIGLEGAGMWTVPPQSEVVVTRGEALETSLLLNKLPILAQSKGCPLSKLRVILGGGPPSYLSTIARLLARAVGEMVIWGDGVHIDRLTQLILGETGLAVPSNRVPVLHPNDAVIWCGRPPKQIAVDIALFFRSNGYADYPDFSWEVGAVSQKISHEMASYAAGEAFLLSVSGWKQRHLQFGMMSIRWVETVGKLAKDLGFSLRGVALDTPHGVGYNDYNL